MKKFAFASLTLISLSADYHDPSISLNVDARYPFEKPGVHLSLKHQFTYEFDDCNAIILHGLINPHSHKTFHNEVAVGYRRMYEDFGFGTNLLYAHQNITGFFNHQLVPGVELNYKRFGLAFNRYLPFKTSVELKKETYLFHDVSEISLSYRISKKYGISASPYFNHNTKRFGYSGTFSASVFDNWQLSVTPYCEPKVNNGVAFSIGVDFGGTRSRANAPLTKSHRFFYTSNAKEVKKYTPSVGPSLIPSVEPVILRPADSHKPDDKSSKNWWEYIFGGTAKK